VQLILGPSARNEARTGIRRRQTPPADARIHRVPYRNKILFAKGLLFE